MENIILNKINTQITELNSTMLCIGPMSLNIVDAAIEVSNIYNFPLMLISSRRQIDSEIFGGGYVNKWNTKSFTEYVKKKDIKKNIILARDHGGPWQNDIEIKNKLSEKDAINSAKLSFEEDINNNFDILHIDPSISPFRETNIDRVIDNLYELYEHCYFFSKKKNKSILFEIGTEEQSLSSNNLEILDYSLSKIFQFVDKNKLIKPTFTVAQTGTKVIEFENIGSLDSPTRVPYEIPPEIQIPILSNICKKFNIFLKAHNTDYLSNEALSWHPRLGIHAANIAPEFGVLETRTLYDILKTNNLNRILDNIIELSYNSKKWKKWLKKNSKLTNYEKSILSCHYVYSDDIFKENILKAKRELKSKNINLDKILKNIIKNRILEYAYNFRILNQ